MLMAQIILGLSLVDQMFKHDGIVHLWILQISYGGYHDLVRLNWLVTCEHLRGTCRAVGYI